MSGIHYLILAVFCNSIANVLFKAGSILEGFTLRKGFFLGLGLTVGLANTVSFIKSLETLDLGVAYPIFCAASIVLIALGSALALHETVSLQRTIGLVILCFGILVLWRA
jgi:multidrug transporter EmrE-like cation transporter